MGATTHSTPRSDAEVFAAARKHLDDCASIPGTVRVHVADGTVRLTGTVDRLSQRTEAEAIVRPIIGERRLLNGIIVLPLPSAGEVDAS